MHSLKLIVSTNKPTFNAAEQQDEAEAIEKLLDVVTVFKFCMYRCNMYLFSDLLIKTSKR